MPEELCPTCHRPLPNPDHPLAYLPDFVTSKQAAEALGMDHRTILTLVKQKKLPGCRFMHNIFIDKQDFINYADHTADPAYTPHHVALRRRVAKWIKEDSPNRQPYYANAQAGKRALEHYRANLALLKSQTNQPEQPLNQEPWYH